MAIMSYKPYGRTAMNVVPYMLSSSQSSRRGVKSSTTGSIVTTKRARKPARALSLKTLIKRAEASKHYTLDSNIATLHNTVYTCVPTQGVLQGVTNAAGRSGDEIYVCALKMHGIMVSAAAAGAYSFRILVGWTGEEITTAGAGTGLVSGLGTTEVFLPNTVTYATNGVVNPKAFTCLYDQTFDINSQIATISDVNSFSFTVPINQTFNYQSSASIQGKTRNLAIVVVSTVYGGVTGTTASGACVLAADLIYKD